MPSMPLEVLQRNPRLTEQRWLLDAVVNAIGPEWDQLRLGVWGSVCGHDSQGDFVGLRSLVKTYNDLSREFMKAARRRELRAEDELKQGHEWSARESFFTAATLYGGAQWPIEANTPLNIKLNEKKVQNYKRFIALAGRHVEQIDIPFGEQKIPAILSLPMTYEPGEKLPCVVIISGMDGWKEVSVAMDGDKWLQRGFAVLAVDVPGQGECLTRSIWFDPKTYPSLAPVVFDFAAARAEIDEKKIVVHGLSFGSYWSTTMAASEPRFLACGVAMTTFEPDGFSIFKTASPTFNLRFMYMTNSTSQDQLDALRTQMQPATKVAPTLRCPCLVAVGEDDQLTDLGYTFEFLNALGGPKSIILFEGEGHDIHGARSGQIGPSAYTMVADWLTQRVRGLPMVETYTEVDSTGATHQQPWGEGKREYSYGIIESSKAMVFGSEW